MSKWSQDQYTRYNVFEIERKEKRYIKSSLHPSIYEHFPYKKSPILTLPLWVWLLSYPKLLPLFVTSDKGYRVSSRHLVSTRRASISILIIIVGVGVIIVLECLRRRRGRLHKATKASLPSGNMTDMSVHLAQLITKSVKVSIHALKLCHDRIKSHTSHRRRGSRGGWSWRSGKSYHFGPPRV